MATLQRMIAEQILVELTRGKHIQEPWHKMTADDLMALAQDILDLTRRYPEGDDTPLGK